MASLFHRLFAKKLLLQVADLEQRNRHLSDNLALEQGTVQRLFKENSKLANTLADVNYLVGGRDGTGGLTAQVRDASAGLYALRRQHELILSFNPKGANGEHECCPCVKDLQGYSQKAVEKVGGLTFKGVVESIAQKFATEEAAPGVKKALDEAGGVALDSREVKVDLKPFVTPPEVFKAP